MIEIKNLCKEFKNKDKTKAIVLNDLNLIIPDNTIYGIIGLSGAGKTTLLKLLTCLEKPTSGSIIVDNVDINKINSKNLRKFRQNLGVVFQGYNLLMQSNIYDNIAFPLKINKIPKWKHKTIVQELLELVSLEDKIKDYPSTLSGGQCQRVAIARALSTTPKILLLDEPTSALDPITTKQLIKLLLDIKEKYKITIIIITHEMSVVEKLCDKVAVLNDGCVAEAGDVIDVMNNPQNFITKQLLGLEE